MKTIGVFGDSITWGANDYEGGGWVTRLRNYFQYKSLSVDKDIDVYNLGVSGDNTEDLLRRFDVETKAREPDTIIFAIGINDSQFLISKRDNRVPLDNFESNLYSMIKRSVDAGKNVIILGLTRVDESKTTPIPWNTDKEYKNEYIEKYNNILKKLSKEFGLKYVDVYDLLSNNDLSDGLHPNATGHKKIFEMVKSKLLKI